MTLIRLLDNLRTARRDYDWDLATLCIETCEQSARKIAAANRVMLEPTATAVTLPVPAPALETLMPGILLAQSGTQSVTEDMNLPFSLDIPWDHLWDDMAEPWDLLDQF